MKRQHNSLSTPSLHSTLSNTRATHNALSCVAPLLRGDSLAVACPNVSFFCVCVFFLLASRRYSTFCFPLTCPRHFFFSLGELMKRSYVLFRGVLFLLSLLLVMNRKISADTRGVCE
ncbi:membrane-associated protein, putative [Bodo saltans]|uniref:Membrane-associated protein, putative n=1 Tax=Bodo saltans TaxID=75058 RepID=A0A0S4IHA6_BODSA|nr:membrane-associated protein, putative [Bodo saltans]|eukprot:CUE62185.1 membrane-associated protein, putative [Bodo saltans]